MARRRRPHPEGSLSFLDVICCGFGAMILLLMLTKSVQPHAIEASMVILNGKLAALQEQLFSLRGESKILNRDLNAKHEQLSEYEKRIAILRGEMASAKSRSESLRVDTSTDDAISGQLATAKQKLTEEMKSLLGTQHQAKNQLIGGIPVDSEYIIFVIDTSGSMFGFAWDRMLREFQATLSIYPAVKGIQVMSDQGSYLFSSYRGKWIPDSPARRQIIIQNMRNWNVFSASSPVKGIETALRDFGGEGKKISIYVFGDEFTGESITDVVNTVDRLNRKDANGNSLVRIHAVGFPTQWAQEARSHTTGIRFATLMRELTERNGGTFVALNDFR